MKILSVSIREDKRKRKRQRNSLNLLNLAYKTLNYSGTHDLNLGQTQLLFVVIKSCRSYIAEIYDHDSSLSRIQGYSDGTGQGDFNILHW